MPGFIQATWSDAKVGDYFVQGDRRGTITGFTGPEGEDADEVSWKRDDGVEVYANLPDKPILLRRP